MKGSRHAASCLWDKMEIPDGQKHVKHLLVFRGADLLQEVSRALARGASETLVLKIAFDLFPGTLVHYLACRIHAM